jgi:nicotinic acid mononucleotide adenylyltransferase
VGSDILTSGSYRDWHRWADLEREEKILVSERAGYPLPKGVLPKPFARAGRCEKDISSTQIRALLREGKDIEPYTGEKVAEYIRKHKLYQTQGR